MTQRSRTILSILGVTKLDDKFSILIVTFLSIVLTGLAVTTQTAIRLKRISPSVDASGRQRMLTQRMMGRAFLLASGDRTALSDGRKSAAEFEEGLAALRGGGRTAGVELAPAPGAISLYLDQLETRWRVFKPEYEWLLKNADKRASVEYKRRLGGLEAQSDLLLAATEEVTRRLRRHASARVLNGAIGLLLGLAAAALLTFALAFRTLRRELIKPLEELISSAERISTGDYHAVPAEIRDGELGTLALALEKISDSAVKRINADKITNTLLNLAVETEDLPTLLKIALETVLTADWLCVEPKGAIFIADNAAKKLTLAAQSGLPAAQWAACAEVGFGRCLCGRAAEAGEVIYAGGVEARHENMYEDIKEHGHYCVPMLSGGRLVGVLSLYLAPDYLCDRDEVTQLKGIAALLAQIIEKKKVQTENRKMSEALRQAAEAVFITGTDGRITYANEAFERMTGFSAEEALGKTPNLLKSGEHSPEYYSSMWDSMQKGLPWTGRIVNKRKDGGLFTVQANIFPLKDSSGKTTAYVTLQEDVSELVDTEEQLRQSQKMEAVGRLAGGVAHDFNNILMAIDGYAGFIRRSLPAGSQEASDAGEIIKAVQKAAALTRQLLAFSRKQKALFQALDLRQAVLGGEKMLRRLLGEMVTLNISVADDSGMIKADPGQIDQIMMNLLVNAKDAMPEGGSIEIRVAGHKSILPVPTPVGTMPAGEYTVLSVYDTGAGMDKETLARIFDPFFTTKPKGKGTGLGLSIVYGAVKHHGAYITVASRPGKGSTFTLYFPVFSEPGGKGELPPAQALRTLPAPAFVLLAEDDPMVLASVERMLRELGAEVRAFPEPGKLLEFAAGYAGGIDILLTDIVMPGMDGFALAERLTAQKTGVRVIYMSGYTDPDIFKGRLGLPGIVFLQKPFNEELLAETLSRVLAAGAV